MSDSNLPASHFSFLHTTKWRKSHKHIRCVHVVSRYQCEILEFLFHFYFSSYQQYIDDLLLVHSHTSMQMCWATIFQLCEFFFFIMNWTDHPRTQNLVEPRSTDLMRTSEKYERLVNKLYRVTFRIRDYFTIHNLSIEFFSHLQRNFFDD